MTTNRTSRSIRAISLAVLCLAAFARIASAQTVFDQNGFGANHDSYTVLPYEYVDPLSGNLLLVVTDLTLPGNAGFNLSIQRVYNSAVYPHYAESTNHLRLDEDSWAGVGWRLHFGRILHEEDNSAGGTLIEMSDGSQHPLYHSPTSDGWITKELWVYNKSTHMLKLPNGMIYNFGRSMYLGSLGVVRFTTQISDPFNNTVTFGYFDNNDGPPDGVRSIHQDLGQGQSRDVTFRTGSLGELTWMDYGSMHWQYTQLAYGGDQRTALVTVQPPAGLPWGYDYESDIGYVGLIRMRVPNGGVVDYTYGDATRIAGPTTRLARVVTQRRIDSMDHTGVTPGTWYFSYDQGDNKDTTIVSCPCGTTAYRYNGVGLTGSFAAWSVGTLAERTISDPGSGTPLERELMTWRASEPISTDVIPGVNGIWSDPAVYSALPAERTVRRGPYSWVTDYDYHDGQGRYNDYGRPFRIREVGDLSRTTTQTFNYDFTARYIVDRVDTRTVQIGGESITSYTAYDLNTGFPISTNVNGVITTFEKTDQGNIFKITDANGHFTTFTYQWGLAATTTTPKVATSRVIDSSGVVLSETVGSLTTHYVYDGGNRILQIQPPGANTTFYGYDQPQGWVAIGRGPSQTSYQLDAFGRVIETKNQVGIHTQFERDSCGRPTRQSLPYVGSPSRWVMTAYDALGRVTQATAPDGVVTTRNSYDGSNVTVTDAENRATLYVSKGFGTPSDGRLTTVHDANGQDTNYQYDVYGHLTRATGPGSGPVRTWTYNSKGWLDHVTLPESGTTSYTYDLVGNITRISDANGQVTTLAYDENNRITSRDAPGTEADATFSYDTSGRLSYEQSPQMNTTLTYDAAGRVATKVDQWWGGTHWVSAYGYDANDNLTSLTYPSGRVVNYSYDAENRLLAIQQNGTAFASNFSYDDGGRLASYTTGAVTHAVTYDARDRVARVTSGAIPNAPDLDQTYQYSPAGNVTLIDDPRPSMRQTFVYDALNRLTSASGPYGPLGWTYDAMGNRQSDTQAGATTTYAYDPATQRLVSTSGASTESFTYDAAGQLVGDKYGTYSYLPTGVLRHVTGPAGSQLSADYYTDVEGRRTIRRVSDQGIYNVDTYTFRDVGGRVLSEIQNQCNVTASTRDLIYAGPRLVGAVKMTLDQPRVYFDRPNATVAENAGSTGLVAWVDTPTGAALACSVTVAYETVTGGTTGTAKEGTNFGTTRGTITFPAGSPSHTSRTITVPIFDDGTSAPDLTFTARLANALGARIDAPSSMVTAIQNVDAVPSLTMSPITVNEGAGQAIFTVNVSAPSGYIIDLNYLTNDGTAHAGSDFTAPPVPSVLHIPAGATSATIAIPIRDDLIAEPDETFVLQIYNPVHATLGSTGAWATIHDNERPRAEISSAPGVFFADSTAKAGYDDYIVIGNRWDGGSVPARLTFTRSDGSGFTHDVTVPRYGRLTLRVGDEPGLSSQDEVSVAVQSLDPDPSHKLDADHSVYWGPNWQSGRSTEGVTPSYTWFFAEGAVGNTTFDEYVTLFNPTNAPQDVNVYFQGPNGTITSTVVRVETGPGRQKIHVNDYVLAATGGAASDVSVVVICYTAPIVAERTMTWWLNGEEVDGHSSPGVPAGAQDWYFAEGDTGFSTYFPVFNLANATTHVQVDYLHANGNRYTQMVDVPAYARLTIVPPALPLGSYGVHMHADQGIAAERSVYGGPNWTLGTSGVGSTTPLINTYLSEGATGSYWDTYILIANPSETTTANVWLAFITDSGQLTWDNVTIAPHSRQTVFVDAVPGMASALFRTEVRSTNVPVVAERVTYWPGSSGGTNALAASLSGKLPTGTAGTVSREPTLGFNPYTTTRPRAPAATLGFYQVVTEGRPVGWTPEAADTGTPPKKGGATDTPAIKTTPGVTTNDIGSSGWYGAHLTGGRP